MIAPRAIWTSVSCCRTPRLRHCSSREPSTNACWTLRKPSTFSAFAKLNSSGARTGWSPFRPQFGRKDGCFMQDPHDRTEETLEWMRYADRDLEAARRLLLGDDPILENGL